MTVVVVLVVVVLVADSVAVDVVAAVGVVTVDVVFFSIDQPSTNTYQGIYLVVVMAYGCLLMAVIILIPETLKGETINNH